MTRLESYLRIAALATIPVTGLFVCWFLLQASSAVSSASKQSTSALMQLNMALATVNRSCGTSGNIQPCGTLAEVDKLSTHASDLIVQTQIAVHHADAVSQTEAQMLPKWNRQITQTLGNVNQTAFDASKTLTTANSSLQVLTTASQGVITDADRTLLHVDALVTDPDIKQSIASIDKSAQNIADSTAQADAILTDAKVEEQKFTHAAPKKLGFWAALEAGGDFVKHFLPPLF